jgi:hypothetical protein
LLSTLTVTSNLGWGPGTLRAAVDQANFDGGGDTINFSLNPNGDTIQLLTSEIAVSGQVEMLITKDVTIQGPGAGLLAIDANYGGRAFEIRPGAHVTISGLTIRDGESETGFYSNDGSACLCDPDPNDGYGGGILNEGTLTLSGCTVTGNRTTVPGGIGEGGGVANFGTMTMSGCTVTDNSAYAGIPGYGGGIYNDGTMTLSGSTVTGNTTGPAAPKSSKGGGIFNDWQGHLTILSSVVKNNTASDGPDICNLGSITISKDSSIGSKVSRR